MDYNPIISSLQLAKNNIDIALAEINNGATQAPAVAPAAPQPTPTPEPSPTVVVQAITTATPAQVANPKLSRVNAWLGIKTVGAYVSPFARGYGKASPDWRYNEWLAYAKSMRAMGIDYLAYKVGERGVEWLDGQMASIRQAGLAAGVGMAPYIFPYPQSWQADARVAIKACQVAGGVILDCEEAFTNYPQQLQWLVDSVRTACPNACIIVSGYGDPAYAFGGKWNMGACKNADAYQPQWYFKVWDKYKQGYKAALDWGVNDVASQLQKYGLGLNYPVQPCIMADISPSDYQPTATYLKAWHASLMLWHAGVLNPQMVAAYKAGMQA